MTEQRPARLHLYGRRGRAWTRGGGGGITREGGGRKEEKRVWKGRNGGEKKKRWRGVCMKEETKRWIGGKDEEEKKRERMSGKEKCRAKKEVTRRVRRGGKQGRLKKKDEWGKIEWGRLRVYMRMGRQTREDEWKGEK